MLTFQIIIPVLYCGIWYDVLTTMLIKVKTLTGKEIEIDIEPTDKVERIKGEPSQSEEEREELVIAGLV